jgi:hypothetical protein
MAPNPISPDRALDANSRRCARTGERLLHSLIRALMGEML